MMKLFKIFIFILLSFVICCKQHEILFPATNQTHYHIGLRVLKPEKHTLFHLKGSEILTCFDFFSMRFKSMNYISNETLHVREILSKPLQLVHYKNDLLVYVEEGTYSVNLFNIRYSTKSELGIKLRNETNFSMIVSSFLEQDLLIVFGENFMEAIDLKSQKMIAFFSESNLSIRSIIFFPKSQIIVSLNNETITLWKLSCNCDGSDGAISKITTLNLNTSNYASFLEQIPLSESFLSIDQDKGIVVWSIDENTQIITVNKIIKAPSQCSNNINEIKAINKDLAILICQESTILVLNISSENITYETNKTSKIIDITNIENENVACLYESGFIDVLYLQNYTWSTLFLKEKYSEIDSISDINYLQFYNLYIATNSSQSGLIAVQNDISDKNSLFLINTYIEDSFFQISFEEEIKKVMNLGFLPQFIVWTGNAINVYNKSDFLYPLWELNKLNFTIDLIDVIVQGDETKDALVESHMIVLYSRKNAQLEFYNADGNFSFSYNLSEKFQNIKLFCSLNTFQSISFITEDDKMGKLTYNSETKKIESFEIIVKLKNITGCKNELYNYGDEKVIIYNNETMHVMDFKKEPVSLDFTILSKIDFFSYDFLAYNKKNSIANIMGYNFEKASVKINTAQINKYFKNFMLLENKKFQLTGYYFNEKESYETLFESNCEDLLGSKYQGICLKNECENYIDEYSTGFVKECEKDSFIVNDYLGSQKKACRKCRSHIPNCLECSSSENCTQCESNYYQISSKNSVDESFPYCLNLGDISYFQNKKQVIENSGKYFWCSNLFKNCLECDSTSCLKCETDFSLENGHCKECSTPENYVQKFSNGSLLCTPCSESLENCAECLNSQICTKCQANNYFYLNGNTTSCNNCSETIYPNMYRSGPNDGSGYCNLCSSKLEHCINCNGSDSRCTLCEGDYFLDSNGKCNNCTTPNVFKDSNNTCHSCSSVFPNCDMCNITANVCFKCQENLFFNEENQCVACDLPEVYKDGKTDGSGHCKMCNQTLKNCSSCQNSSQCDKCVTNYYLDAQNLCTTCKGENFAAQGKNDGSGHCFNCNSLIENCQSCEINGNITKCLSCSNEFYLTDEGRCVSCDVEHFPEYYQYNSPSGGILCKRCSHALKDCQICEGNSTKCKKCNHGFYFEDDGQCSDCSEENMIKNGGDQGYGTCKLCLSCELCSNKIAHCKECSNLEKNNTICEECNIGYFLSNNNCEKCDDACLSCENHANNCSQCNQKYYHPIQSMNSCVACDSSNKIVVNNTCFTLSVPSAVLNNTIINENDARFSEINNGLFLNLQNLCTKEGFANESNHSEIYYVLSSNAANYNKFDLLFIRISIGNNLPAEHNSTEYNYNDPEWKIFGKTLKNSLQLQMRYDFDYIFKYYCFNDFQQENINKFNLIQIKTKKNSIHPSKILLNFANFTNTTPLNDKILSKIICLIEKMTNLSNKNLIQSLSTNKKEKILCKTYENTLRRNLATNNYHSNYQLVTLEILNDPLKTIDNNTQIINSTLNSHHFIHDFNDLFTKELIYKFHINSTSTPSLNSFDLVSDEIKENLALPLISVNLIENINRSAVFEIRVLKKKGIIYMRLIEGYTNNLPSFQDLKNYDPNDSSKNSAKVIFNGEFLLEPQNNFTVFIPDLTIKQNYTLFYAVENVLSTQNSQIWSIGFEEKEKIEEGSENSYLKNYKFLILAVLGGLVLLIFVSCVLYCVFKRMKGKTKEMKYNAFQSAKEDTPDNIPSKNSFDEKEV